MGGKYLKSSLVKIGIKYMCIVKIYYNNIVTGNEFEIIIYIYIYIMFNAALM